MANQKSVNQRLKEIKVYASKLSKASKWRNSRKSIATVTSGKNAKKRDEYIYEFYCLMRILSDLKINYRIDFVKGAGSNVSFPRNPGLKKNYPYFILSDPRFKAQIAHLHAGIKIKGQHGEPSAPDISYLTPNKKIQPDHTDVIMIHDAKFKHKANAKLTSGEFSNVHYMIVNLGCYATRSIISFSQFSGQNSLMGNCILTNGKAFKSNINHHKLYHLMEAEDFDVNKNPRVIG